MLSYVYTFSILCAFHDHPPHSYKHAPARFLIPFAFSSSQFTLQRAQLGSERMYVAKLLSAFQMDPYGPQPSFCYVYSCYSPTRKFCLLSLRFDDIKSFNVFPYYLEIFCSPGYDLDCKTIEDIRYSVRFFKIVLICMCRDASLKKVVQSSNLVLALSSSYHLTISILKSYWLIFFLNLRIP